MSCHRVRTLEVIGQKRMPKPHIAAGCEVQLGFNTQETNGGPVRFVSVSLTRQQAFEVAAKLNRLLEVFYGEEETMG